MNSLAFDELNGDDMSERRVSFGWILVGLLVVMLFVAVGCGRTELFTACATDADCPEGECVGGVCAITGEEPDISISDVPEEDTDIDGGDPECVSDLDCGDGQCGLGADGGCTEAVCEAGVCVEQSCDPQCGDGQEEIGCQCFPTECDVDADCDGRICDDGTCRGCLADDECPGTDICGADGFCEDGPDCNVDDDCMPYEMCTAQQTCVDRPECTFDTDCGNDEQCIAGVCTYTPDCEDDSDCTDLAECVGGQCLPRMCRGNSDCPDDELCDAGECVPPPVTSSCTIVTEGQTIAPNERILLEAFAFNNLGQGVAASFTWTSSNPSVATIEGNELVGTSSPGTTTVTAVLASDSGIECEGSPAFQNLGLTPVDEIRVRVVHMETGAAISGAEVHIDGEVAVSDGSGIATLSNPGPGFEVSVFHNDFNYLTVQGVSARDLRLPISPRSGTGPVAGFTGEFDLSQIHTSGDLEIGLAGGSLAGDLLDINLERLLGDPFVTDFSVPGLGGASLPLPGGLTLGGGVFGFDIGGKERYYVQAAGGPRLSWGLAGKLSFLDILGVITDPPSDIGSAIALVLPLFSRFDHGQQPAILQAMPRVLDVIDINNNGDTSEWLPDYNNFPEIDLAPSVRQQLSTSVAISSLPVLGGQQSEVAVLVGGVQLDGPGFTPLGISATSGSGGQPEARTVYMAPQYGSAVGGRYAMLAIAFATGGDDLAGDFSVSLWNGQTLPTGISLGTFPDSSTGDLEEATRTLTVDATAGPVFRVRLVGTNRSWDVWTQGPPGQDGEFSHTIVLPEAPQGTTDIFGNGGGVIVDAIRTSVSVDDLVRASGVSLRRAGLVTTTFNRTTFR